MAQASGRFEVTGSIGSMLALLACSVIVSASARAQASHPVSVDATLGVNAGRGGGEFRGRTGVAVDALFAVRLPRASRGNAAVGLGMGWQGAIAGADDCPLAATWTCANEFPRFYSVAAFAGAEVGRMHGATVRLLAGPAYFREDEGESTVGAQARLDLSTPTLYHVAFVASARLSVLPNFRGDAYTLSALGLGLRVR
jgi:hypothetical protein